MNGKSEFTDDLVFNTTDLLLSVDNIENDIHHGEKRVFHIDGTQAVNAKRPGIYIIKENGKTRKIIVR